MDKKNHFVALTGVMGSGKTTACNLLKEGLGFHVLEETVNENAFLPLFYKDPARWALPLQLFFLEDRVRQLERMKTLLKEQSVIQDSFVYQDNFTYVKAQKALGRMSEAEFDLYQRFFDFFLAKDLPRPDLIINLEAPLDVLKERIKRRARDFETDIDALYLEKLCKLQQEWVGGNHPFRVVSVDTERWDLAKNRDHQKDFIEMVKSLLVQN